VRRRPRYQLTGNTFSGEVDWVQIDIGGDGHEHLIAPEDRLNIAMAKQ
jgi:arylsulfatase